MKYVAKVKSTAHNYSSKAMRLKAQNAGVLEYYTLNESLDCTEVLFDNEFILALDSYLIAPKSVNKSLRNRIKEFLDYEDKRKAGVVEPIEHYERILESLDSYFLESTMQRVSNVVRK